MASFVKKYIWYFILLSLVMALVAITGSAYKRGGVNERRITAIETSQATIHANIEAINKTMDDGFDNLSEQIKTGDANLDARLLHSQVLIEALTRVLMERN